MRKTLVIIFTLLFLIGCGKNNNINNLNLDTTILDQKKAEAALKIEEFYTVESWQKLQEALILPQDNSEEIDEKTLKIESALENLKYQKYVIIKQKIKLDSIFYIFGIECYIYNFEFIASDDTNKIYLFKGETTDGLSKLIDVSKEKDIKVNDYAITVKEINTTVKKMTLKSVDINGNVLETTSFELPK